MFTRRMFSRREKKRVSERERGETKYPTCDFSRTREVCEILYINAVLRSSATEQRLRSVTSQMIVFCLFFYISRVLTLIVG